MLLRIVLVIIFIQIEFGIAAVTKKNECDNKICVRKCCNFGYKYSTDGPCLPTNNTYSMFLSDFNNTLVRDFSLTYEFVIDKECPDSKRFSQFILEPPDDYYLEKSNLTWIFRNSTKYTFDWKHYCIDYLDDAILPIYCHESPERNHFYSGKFLAA